MDPCAKMLVPAKMAMHVAAIQSSVVDAFRDCGARKAGTPLLMASIPVKAAQPEAKARTSRSSVTPCKAGGGGVTWAGAPCKTRRTSPITTISSTVPMNT